MLNVLNSFWLIKMMLDGQYFHLTIVFFWVERKSPRLHSRHFRRRFASPLSGKDSLVNLFTSVGGLFQSAALFPAVGSNRNMAADLSSSHRVGPEWDSASAAGAELGLAVGAQVAAAIGKLGLVADAAGGRVIPVDGGAGRHRRLSNHRLPVARQLLLDPSVDRRRRRRKGNSVYQLSNINKNIAAKLPWSQYTTSPSNLCMWTQTGFASTLNMGNSSFILRRRKSIYRNEYVISSHLIIN